MKKLDEVAKGALYIRVSTQWQVDKDSLPFQREELSKYVQYALGIEQWEVFEDAGYSAKNTDRPAYQQMMARMRTGEFTHLVVWKIDRISRNLIDFATMYDELKKLGVIFVSKNEQFDTSSAMGEAMLKIILVFAELERNMTSERVSSIMLSRAKEGQWNGGRVSFGYRYDADAKNLVVDETEAELARRIYSWYLEDGSLLKVARRLNENGYHSRTGKPWSPVTVRNLIRNPVYIGSLRYNYRDESKGTTFYTKDEKDWILVPNHHPPIIDEETYEKAGRMLTRNDRAGVTPKTYSRKNIHVFAGLLTCEKCGSTFQATIDKARSNGWRPSIYLCSRHRRFSDCANKYVSDVSIGPFVLNFFANLIKAQRSFGKTTSIAVLESKLIRGPQFDDVKGIAVPGLQEIHRLFRIQKFGYEPFEPVIQGMDTSGLQQERELLEGEKRRLERAGNRLRSLYLYAENAMSEKDYLLERKEIEDSLERVSQREKEISESEGDELRISDEDFLQQASYYMMTQELLEKRIVNYERLIRCTNPKITKEFIGSVSQNFCILDGKITSIRLKNGITVRFLR